MDDIRCAAMAHQENMIVHRGCGGEIFFDYEKGWSICHKCGKKLYDHETINPAQAKEILSDWAVNELKED